MTSAPFLIISGHDYRSPRKANMHFIADELARRGTTRFFSIGFSVLSKIKQDPRVSLWGRANFVENCKGVDAYLWRSLLHPCNLKKKVLEPVAAAWFCAYRNCAPPTLRQWIKESNTILIESGMGIVVFDLIKRLNPKAQLIYLASDALAPIGCDPFLRDELARVARSLDRIYIPSIKLAAEFRAHTMLNLIPHGIDAALADIETTSPYSGGVNLISVGNSLFDRGFFQIAARELPDVTFHIIGGGVNAAGLDAPNIVLYDEMPFRDTIPYIRHAHAGIAAYDPRNVAPYHQDTSLKLMQYGFFGIPAVCPHIVVGSYPGRIGYDAHDAASIRSAIRAALAHGHFPPQPFLTWTQVTDRILDPANYPDTQVKTDIS
jgi:2-beta-glucuronyltransferase